MAPRHHHHGHAHPPVSQAERAATWLSLACAVHCLTVPLAMTVMPLLGASVIELSEGAHLLLTIGVIASASAGVAWGYRRHRDMRVVFATVLGLVAYAIGHLLEGSTLGLALAVTGALVLAASSFLGARLAHHCEDAACVN